MSNRKRTAQDHAASNLARIAQALQNLNKGAESELGISFVQFHLMSELIDLPGSSPQLLAAKAGLHPSTLTQSMKRLARKGFLHAAADPKDSRRKQLTVTRQGRAAILHFRAGSPELLRVARTEFPVLEQLLHGHGGGVRAASARAPKRDHSPRSNIPG